MGGGTNYFDEFSSKTIEEAENLFNRAIKKIEPKTEIAKRNVFISFSMTNENQVFLLREQAINENFGLEFRDYSIKKPFDDEWRREASERIKLTSATVVMIGEDTATRPAVNYEIDESYRQGKKVIGIRIYTNKNHRIPPSMIEHNAPIVNWDLEDINRELNDS